MIIISNFLWKMTGIYKQYNFIKQCFDLKKNLLR